VEACPLRRPMRGPFCKRARDRRSTDPETGVASGLPEAAICVQDIDVQCVLQFTLVNAAGCALHRHTSRVIHRLEWYVRFRTRGDDDDAVTRSSSLPLSGFRTRVGGTNAGGRQTRRLFEPGHDAICELHSSTTTRQVP
jgi:hypothetical protein